MILSVIGLTFGLATGGAAENTGSHYLETGAFHELPFTELWINEGYMLEFAGLEQRLEPLHTEILAQYFLHRCLSS